MTRRHWIGQARRRRVERSDAREPNTSEMSARGVDPEPRPRTADGPPAAELPEAPFRYGVVLLLILTLVLFEIVAPSGNWESAVAFALAGAAFVMAVATWRLPTSRRGQRILLVSGAVAAMVVGIATGAISPAVEFSALAVLLLAMPVTLFRGLLRLVGERGATPQAIAGAIAIYLMLGLLFASIIGFLAEVQSQPYFAQGPDVSDGDRVYYSFTVLTTTGFGDYSAATPTGHALAVLEMLTGQLYLVTVIGVLIGHYVRRRT